LVKIEKVIAPEASGNSTNSSKKKKPFNITVTGDNIFTLLDNNGDGYVDFLDFGHMMQLVYIFSKADIYNRGKLPVGHIAQLFKSYSDYPRVSFINQERARRLDMISQDLYLDVFELLILFKIDDIVDYYVRVSDKTTVYEVELKNILRKCGLRHLPDQHINNCQRGNDRLGIPKYDWECAVVEGVALMSKYYEAAEQFRLARKNKLHLLNTIFVNVDPQIA